ncbi:MAG TPA: SDR family oxidoreductase [Poseidonia sp.]|nr:SDR family oxidoreductase [Poseidonia sp.]
MSRQVALITGAGRRLGAATASRLMDAGWFVFIHVHSSVEAAEKLLEEAVAKNGKQCGQIVQADLTNDEQLHALVAKVKNHSQVQQHGLSGLIHNASFYSQSRFEDTPLEYYRNLNRLHMEAPYFLTQELLPELQATKGAVIGIVDTSWGKSWNGLSHYTSSKAGLRQLMLNLAGELSPKVTVNCIAPGAIMAAHWENEHFTKVLERVPMGRSGSASDVAAAVHHLLESPHLSGQVLHVDGGWSIEDV